MKKLIVLLITSFFCNFIFAQSSRVFGDFDGDGKITAADITHMANIILGKEDAQQIKGSFDISDCTPYITFQTDYGQTSLKITKVIDSFEYSVNRGVWTPLTSTDPIIFGGSKGTLRLRGKSLTGTASSDTDFAQFIFESGNSTKVKVSGDIRTLVNYESYRTVNCKDARFCCLFKDCAAIISAPQLPSFFLADNCYFGMFAYCTSLLDAPELPAETLNEKCYARMFQGCSSLQSAPVLPAEELMTACYASMFSGCTSLAIAPELPALKLAVSCYSDMFYSCSSLKNVPVLNALVLYDYCYANMFEHCNLSGQKIALPAETLAPNCYSRMFADSNISYIKMLATDISASGCLNEWLLGASSSGTFVKNAKASWDVRGSSGIPNTWFLDSSYSHNGHECVDLGITSGGKTLYWATTNLGASKPEEYGKYYQWAAADDRFSEQNYYFQSFIQHTPWEYKWFTSIDWDTNKVAPFSKYCVEEGYDQLTTIEPEDDDAHILYGGNWRIPTKDEFEELLQQTTWIWSDENNVYGYTVMGSNGRTIFLPAAETYDGQEMYYWTSTLHTDFTLFECAYSFHANSQTKEFISWARYNALPIRAVCTLE